MKVQKLLVKLLYVILFILCCYDWLYTRIIFGDSIFILSEFIIAESIIFVILFLFIYLTIKGHSVLNIGLLFFPNFIWLFSFIQDVFLKGKYFNFYSTVVSSSMMLVIIFILIWNIIKTYRKINLSEESA